jgi:Patatin-like phospholipase
VTEVLITSYDLESRDSWFFARHKAREEASYDFPMCEVARATSAAPTYFRPERLPLQTPTAMVDGGVFANNPAMCAYVETIKLHGQQDVVLVSIGTGQVKTPIHYRQAQTWGLAGWARRLLSVVMDGVSDTVEHQLGWLLPDRDGLPRYFRFQVELPAAAASLDHTGPSQVGALKQAAGTLINTNTKHIDALCELLSIDAPPPPKKPRNGCV